MRAADGQLRRVLMTADAVGGVWTYALDLARGLGDRDIEVVLAVMGPAPSAAQRSALHALGNVTLFHHPFRLEWMDDPWDDVDASADWLVKVADDVQPDIVHLNGYCHAALNWKAPVIVVGHSCVLSWWAAVHGTDMPAARQRYAENVGRGLRAADVVIAPTAAMLSALRRHYGPIPRARVIPNGRWVEEGGGVKESFVLTAGRLWDRAKNVDAMVSAASAVAWPVRVAGDAHGLNGETLQLTGVEWLGRLAEAELLAWMRRAAIYALPARYEPFGLSALEAAISGCALVLGDIPSLREVWGDAALYVPPDECQALIGALRSLIECDDRRVALAERARTRARALSPARMTDDYCDAYRSLLSLAAV